MKNDSVVFMNYSKVIALALLLASGAASSANWVQRPGSEKSSVYIDADSIASGGGGLVKAWVTHSFLENQESLSYPKFYYQSSVSLELYNCAERTAGILQEVFYSEPERQGVVANTIVLPRKNVSLDDVVPGSVGEGSLNFVCSRFNRKSKK